MPSHSKSKLRARAIKAGYRSGLEESVAKNLEDLGVKFEYETMKINWVDHKVRRYTPDYVLENGIIVETKGVFTAADRRKHLEVRKQHPELDIRFVFSNSKTKLNKMSKTTYGDWCLKHGFKYHDKLIPEEWLYEVTK